MAIKLIETDIIAENFANAVKCLNTLGGNLNDLLTFVGDSNKGFKSGFRACNSAHGHINGVVKALQRIQKLAISYNKHKETSPEKQARDIAKEVKNGNITKADGMKAIESLFNELLEK